MYGKQPNEYVLGSSLNLDSDSCVFAMGSQHLGCWGEDPAAHGHWCTFTDFYHTKSVLQSTQPHVSTVEASFQHPLIWLDSVAWLALVEVMPYHGCC